jgi:membrane protein
MSARRPAARRALASAWSGTTRLPTAARLVAASLRRYVDDGMIDRAPALAYYGILSLFPLLLIAFAVVRLITGDGAPAELAAYAREKGASGAVAEALRSAAQTARAASAPTAGAAGAAGLAALIYGGSRAFTAAGRALDVIGRHEPVKRSLMRRAADIGWTLVVLAMVIVLLVLMLAGGRALQELVTLVGLDDELDVWGIARWPAAAAMALLIVAVVRWAAPTGGRPPFRLATHGAAVSVGVLLVETVAFDVYVTSIASYNKTYGTFAAGIILLLWIWLASIAFLFGAELDAARTESRSAGR